jgi:hypothetical protein
MSTKGNTEPQPVPAPTPSAKAKQATIYETSDGTQFLVAADAQQHQLRLNVREFIRRNGQQITSDRFPSSTFDEITMVMEYIVVENVSALLDTIKAAANITPEA